LPNAKKRIEDTIKCMELVVNRYNSIKWRKLQLD
jgi:hypothetical protein